MYLINVSDDHRPINMIVYTGVPTRNMPIAPPERFEWVPTSISLIFRDRGLLLRDEFSLESGKKVS